MEKWTLTDIPVLEEPTKKNDISSWRVSDILFNSANCRCIVDSINPTTGEYRIIIQGTLKIDQPDK